MSRVTTENPVYAICEQQPAYETENMAHSISSAWANRPNLMNGLAPTNRQVKHWISNLNCLSVLAQQNQAIIDQAISRKHYLFSRGSSNEPRHDKTNKMTVRPAKTQISLDIRQIWSESSLCAQWVAKGPSFLLADSEDWSDWADAQADLSLRWAHSHFVCFFFMSRLK